MSNAVMTGAFTDEAHESFLSSRTSPDWLNQVRRDAWKQFQAMDWPARNSEEWSRTDFRAFRLDKYRVSNPEDDTTAGSDNIGVLAAGVENAGGQLAGQTTSHNGLTTSFRLADKWKSKGVVFGPLEQVANEHGDLVQKHLMAKAFDASYDRFAALHAAWLSNGTVLYVPRGVTVDEPLHVLAGLDDGGVDLSHLLVVIEDGAEATLMSEYVSKDPQAKGLHCGGIEILIGDQANLRFVNLQDWGQGIFHFAQQKAIVGKDSSLQWTIGALGSRLAKVNQHVELAGVGANCQVNGTMFTEGTQHLTYNTLQHHAAPSCRSDFLYKAALQDRSRTVWRGLIRVDEAAQKTDGYQRNDNLILSERSRADSIPGLEIHADDVRCTHGSTSGKVDEELIFYARCRGFTRKEAIRSIVTGFFQQVFDRVTIESVRIALGEAIARRVRDYE